MRLEVFCQDRIGLTRELLDLLVTRNIDLRGIEIVLSGRIYLNFSPIEFDAFSRLMTDIRFIPGVTDVRTVAYMPSEREQQALRALLMTIPDPVFSIDLKSKPDLVNPAAEKLFNLDAKKLRAMTMSSLIPGFNFMRWLESSDISALTQQVIIQGRNFLMELRPLFTPAGEQSESTLAGAMIMLKSTARMGHQLQNLTEKVGAGFEHMIAVSPKMQQIIERARKLATLNAPLLIVGDTGTGKDMLAHACHQFSSRSQKPFLALNCASLPDDVMESELFGHAPGAYPGMPEGKKGFFEQADGGSVLLDEIGEMSSRMQVKLLRFLSDGTFRRVGEEHEVRVDVRVICATQKNLSELVSSHKFREDLYYRLNVLSIMLPPLRERVQDIRPLTDMFIARIADEQGITCPVVSARLYALLERYSWPGNVRQLKNVLYRALTETDGVELLPQDIILPQHSPVTLNEEIMAGSLDEIMSRFECSVLSHLYLSYPSTRKLAKRLGVSHTAVANKLREYGLSSPKS